MSTARTMTNILVLGVLKAIGLLISLALISLQAAVFGTSAAADAWYLVRKLITTATGLVEGGVNRLLVPEFVSIWHARGAEGVKVLLRRVSVPLIAGTVALSAVLWIFAPTIVATLAPGFDDSRVAHATLLFRVILVCLPLSVLAAIFGSFQFSQRKFAGPTIAHLLPRIALMVVLLALGTAVTPLNLAVAMVIGMTIMAVMIVWSGVRVLNQPSGILPTSKDPDSGTKSRAFAIGIYLAAQLALGWLDTALASLAGVGGVTILYLAQRLLNSAPGAINASVTAVYYTEYSHAALEGHQRKGAEIAAAIRISLFFILPLSALVFLAAEPLLQLVLQRGSFNHADTLSTAGLMANLAPLLVINATLATLLTAAMADHKLPMVRIMLAYAALTFGLRLSLGIYLGDTFGLTGLAIAIVLSAFAGVSLIWIWLTRAYGWFLTRADGIALGVIVCATAIAATLARIYAPQSESILFNLIAISGIFSTAYLVVCGAARLLELRMIVKVILRQTHNS